MIFGSAENKPYLLSMYNAENYLDGFFKKHREGVVNVSLTEFNEEEFVRNRREEGFRDGLEQGGINMLVTLVKNKVITLAQAAENANMSEEEFKRKFL